jgi:uncharacterized paraquat-inducible protein A
MFADILGMYFGAFVYAFFMYYLVMWIVKLVTLKKIGRLKASIYSFAIAFIITGIISEVSNFWSHSLIAHFPLLIIVFIFDYRAVRYRKCPKCAEKIRVEAVKCKHCHTEVGEYIEEED